MFSPSVISFMNETYYEEQNYEYSQDLEIDRLPIFGFDDIFFDFKLRMCLFYMLVIIIPQII